MLKPRVANAARARQIAITAALLVTCAVVGCGNSSHVVAWQTDAGVDVPGDLSIEATDGGLPRFEPPRIIAGLLDPTDHLQDPALSADELEIYFASPKAGAFDIWRSTRARADAPWDPASLVTELNSAAEDLEPELSGDDLRIYFSSNRSGAAGVHRIWMAQRPARGAAWGAPAMVVLEPFDAAAVQRGAAVDISDTTMIFWSLITTENADLFQATRPDATSAWGAIAPLDSLRSAWSDWDPAFFRANLGLIFGSRRQGDHLTSDLFETARDSASSTFRVPTPIDELNSAAAEGDPWLSEDGHHIVFVSERTGVSRLYESRR